jgi:hypothetical protein
MTGAAALVVCAALLTGTSAAARAATEPAGYAGGGWGTATELAGTLNTRGLASIQAVSCASSGNCSAGGFYASSAGAEAFVVSETNGTWGKLTEVATSRNAGKSAEILALSCAPSGYCTAGGYYTNKDVRSEAFVVSKP